MIEMSVVDRRRAVKAMEYLMEYGEKCDIGTLMHDCNITFEEYRVVSELAMPLLRVYSTRDNNRIRAGMYKGAFNRVMSKIGQLQVAVQSAGMILDDIAKEKIGNESGGDLLAGGTGEDAVQEGCMGYDVEDGNPEGWAV